MTELQIVPTTPTPDLPERVTHVPSAPHKPIVVLKAVIGGTEQTWYVSGDDEEDVAHKLPRVHRYIQELRKRFGGEDVASPPTGGPSTPGESHHCEWHGPMRESTKAPGTWYCPKRKADGSYCPSRWPVRAGEQSA